MKLHIINNFIYPTRASLDFHILTPLAFKVHILSVLLYHLHVAGFEFKLIVIIRFFVVFFLQRETTFKTTSMLFSDKETRIKLGREEQIISVYSDFVLGRKTIVKLRFSSKCAQSPYNLFLYRDAAKSVGSLHTFISF